jgi:hypothetical protein
MSSTTPQTGLAKAETKKAPVITTPEEYGSALERWTTARYNVLSPFTTFSGLQEGYGLIASRVSIDPDPMRGEVYGEGAPWVPKGHVALAKVGLRKIAECGGMSTSFRRTDPRTIAYYWEGDGIARWRGLDGSIVERETPFEWDMRDGSPRLKGFTPKQIDEARKHGLRHCATRAINAAIREYGVKQVYTVAEMAKPFVIVRVVYLPDRSDPDVRRILTENALAGTSSLYAHAHAAALPPVSGEVIDPFEDDRELQPVGRGGTAASAATPAATAGQTPADATLPEGFGYIQKVEVVELKRRDNKGTFPKWTVIDHTGVAHVTVKRELGESAMRYWKDRVAVDIESEENNYQENEIVSLYVNDPAQPTLPDMSKL